MRNQIKCIPFFKFSNKNVAKIALPPNAFTDITHSTLLEPKENINLNNCHVYNPMSFKFGKWVHIAVIYMCA